MLSIITIVLNKENSIEETILSVISQLEEKDEYIIIDGGSTDNTPIILDKYRSKITHLISEPDKGIYDAMNKGIALAKGNMLGIINGGDSYLPHALKYVRQFRGDVLTGNMIKFDRKSSKKQVIKRDESYLKRLPVFMILNHPATFVAKNIYEKYGTFNSSYQILGDKDFFLKLYLNGVKFKFTEKVLAAFETGGTSGKLSSIPFQAKEAYTIRKALGYKRASNIRMVLVYILHAYTKFILRRFKT